MLQQLALALPPQCLHKIYTLAFPRRQVSGRLILPVWDALTALCPIDLAYCPTPPATWHQGVRSRGEQHTWRMSNHYGRGFFVFAEPYSRMERGRCMCSFWEGRPEQGVGRVSMICTKRSEREGLAQQALALACMLLMRWWVHVQPARVVFEAHGRDAVMLLDCVRNMVHLSHPEV